MKKYICKNCGILDKDEILHNGTCERCGENVIKIWGRRGEIIEKYIRHIEKTNTNNKRLLNTAIQELKIKNMKIEAYKNILDEIETLLNKGIDLHLVLKIIENHKERAILDDLIHYNLAKNNLKSKKK